MRRSGTTILFDILHEDRGLDLYYEPFAAAKVSIGGGSGARNIDYFEKVRTVRQEFSAVHPDLPNLDLLNHGAPARPALEFEPHLPQYAREYLRFILERKENTAIKFTRMYCKVAELAALDPRAFFIHIVRNPQEVTASYLFGRGGVTRRKYQGDDFFWRRSKHNPWSNYAFSQHLLEYDEFQHLNGCADFVRILLLWKFKFRETHAAGLKHFGPRYNLFRLDDLRADPVAAITDLYEFIGRERSESVLSWAKSHVRPKGKIPMQDDPRWSKAFARLDLASELEAAGYEQLAEGDGSR